MITRVALIMVLCLFVPRITFCQERTIWLKFNSLKMGDFDEGQKGWVIEDNIHMFDSTIEIDSTQVLRIYITAPSKHDRYELYHWISKKKVKEKGYTWIQYDLKPEKPDEWDTFNLYIGDKGKFTGCQLSSKKKLMMFLGKQKF
jgi:hypothetical protein